MTEAVGIPPLPPVDQIPRRTPILTKETAAPFPEDEMDREWGLITEATRRDLLDRSEVRRALMLFCDQGVNEQVPAAFLNGIRGVDDRVAKLVDRYEAAIMSYLGLPSVPDKLIGKDLRVAAYSNFTPPEEVLELVARYWKKTPEMIPEDMWERINSGEFLRGTTSQERLLVFKRYKYARDVKLLALGAEVVETGGITLDAAGEATLPSGIKVGVDTIESAERANLLNPQLWEKRRQIKDRVYEIFVNGKKYFLKEKKTARHSDTKRNGHINGNTSAQEFAIGKDLEARGRMQEGNIEVQWERPIAHVTYPDGFQFAVFEYEEGLVGNKEAYAQIEAAISSQPDKYTEEFARIKSMAETFVEDPELLHVVEAKSEEGLKALLSWFKRRPPALPKPAISFDDFVRTKATFLKRRAQYLMTDRAQEMGYVNSDIDGYGFKITSDNSGVKVGIVGFDLEYYAYNPQYAAEVRQRGKELPMYKRDNQELGFVFWDDMTRVTPLQEAMFKAILKNEGLLEEESV